MAKFIDRKGERHLSNDNTWMTIIICRGSMNCDIQFDDGNIIRNRAYDCIKKGKVKNMYHPSKYEVGYIGEGKYATKINGKDTKEYCTWSDMLKRGYSELFQKNQITYLECTINKQWHNFQVFAQWFDDNYKEGFELDKDILVKGNKNYSPETCCFVPHEINSLFIKSNISRGKYPIGVRKSGNKFQAQISKKGEPVHLGTFDTPEEAFQTYKIAKEEYIKEMADKWRGQITEPCYDAMYNYQVEITD